MAFYKHLILFVLVFTLLIDAINCSEANKRLVYRLLRQNGFSRNATIAIMGNIHVETGGTYDYRTKQIGGNGYGLFQFDFLKPFYRTYLKQNLLIDLPESQIIFVWQTIYGVLKNHLGAPIAKRIGITLKDKTKTIQYLTKYFSDQWQKPAIPHMERRIRAAQELAKDKTLK